MPLFLFVSAAVVIVLLGQIFAHLFLKGKYVALCSNLIGWRTECYTMKLSCSIDSLQRLFVRWFFQRFSPLNLWKLRTCVLTEKIYFSLIWENFEMLIFYLNIYKFCGN